MTSHFPYPITLEALREFTHPREGHLFYSPLRHGDGVAACNGWIVLRCNRGHWLDRDFPDATGDALRRLDAVPWTAHSRLPSVGWITLDDYRSRLTARPLGVWDDKGRLSPSPVWLIASSVRVRISHLLLISRLPKAEIHPPGSPTLPLAFRFSGGIGFLSPVPPETPFSYHLAPPRRDPYGEQDTPSHLPKTVYQGGLPFHGTWPPPPPID